MTPNTKFNINLIHTKDVTNYHTPQLRISSSWDFRSVLWIFFCYAAMRHLSTPLLIFLQFWRNVTIQLQHLNVECFVVWIANVQIVLHTADHRISTNVCDFRLLHHCLYFVWCNHHFLVTTLLNAVFCFCLRLYSK